MADDNEGKAAMDGNGDASEMAGPAIHILVQYVKDFSFENPNAPMVLQETEQQPKINVSVNVNAKPLDEHMQDFEVELMIDAKADTDTDVVFAVEIVYGGVFRFENIPEENLQPVVMIEGPRLLFPFVRQIISDATRNGGFPPLLLDPIDFGRLYQDRIAQAQADAGEQPQS
ncbi:MAG: protein-export chaperone SecB [Hyphomicrobiales bacterium]|nr:MAG: protein-export chaperone SecB [Hyphomicrobiales bacterium]